MNARKTSADVGSPDIVRDGIATQTGGPEARLPPLANACASDDAYGAGGYFSFDAACPVLREAV
jgi:hypothetical protein